MYNNVKINKQSGSVILEALIAILIFSIGILGLVGMQSTAINTSSDAKYRSQAGFLADQMIGTAWASRLAASNTVVSNVAAFVPDLSMACNPCETTNPNANIGSWANAIAQALPNATASITIAGPVVTVGITWLPPNAPAGTPNRLHTAVTFIN